jgi:signal transduction histidine kinase
MGISPEIIPKLFEPLFTTKAKGMGFGLVVGKRLLEAQGGNLSINSEIDKGTVVVIRMPYEENLNI